MVLAPLDIVAADDVEVDIDVVFRRGETDGPTILIVLYDTQFVYLRQVLLLKADVHDFRSIRGTSAIGISFSQAATCSAR
uniref:hypothetical protein n=1 Tax=Halobaculum gomorrense TaxID=43928 RepID=UPI0011612247|nr:hypothetical protein [Halobaculum gomorrense]